MENKKISKETLDSMKAMLNGCPLMAGREKGDWEDIEGGSFTIEEYYRMESDGKEFYCVTSVEYPEFFFYSGMQLTAFINEYGEDVKAVTLTVGKKRRTKNGNNFIPFYID